MKNFNKKIKIKKIQAREILDSRGSFTLEVELQTEDGLFLASAPSGASIGRYEAKAIELQKAIKNVNKIIRPKLIGKDAACQKEIDELMIKLDGTKDKSKLGANAILAVSMAVCRAGAVAQNLPLYKYIGKYTGATRVKLPRPAFNIINGGAHASNELDFQEFMIVPQAKKYSENLKIASEIYQELRKKLGTNVGDEGGFAPLIRDPEQALDLIQKAVGKTGYRNKVKVVIDAAASEFYQNNRYKMMSMNFNRKELFDYYLSLVKRYPIIAIEDPFSENDFQGFQRITAKLGEKILIIGDDLLATNSERMKIAKEKNLCNGMILKPNQIGTVTESIEAARLARSFGWKIMVSHRSGETGDDFIADLAVGISADFIKAGAPARGERVAKYNRLLKIEEEKWLN